METTQAPPERQAPARAVPARNPLAVERLFWIAVAALCGHLLVNWVGPYGFHRDEFLYMAMGRHLHLWGMDFPPLIAIIAESTRRFLGDSLLMIRTTPAVAHALLIFLAGVAAREFGGGRFSQGLAAFGVALAPIFMRAGNLFQPTILDQLWWTLALLALARIGRTAELSGGAGDRVAWLALAVFAGLGLLTKFSIGFLAVAMLVGLALSPTRRALWTGWPWATAFLALLIGSPSLVGQLRLKFPVLEQMRDLQAEQLGHVAYSDFLLAQLLMFGPILILALLGVLRLLLAPSARGHRAVAWTCIAAFAILLVLHGKPYYVGPIYPVLIGAGAAALELWTGAMAGRAAGRFTGNMVRALVVVLVLAFGALALPLGLPFLSPTPMARYVQALGVPAAVRTNVGGTLRLPQDYADMIGWPQEASAVAQAWRSLTPQQRAEGVVFGASWGQAGALDYYGPRLGLPPAISNSGSYWFWGPGKKPGNVAVILGADSADVAQYFRVVRPWGRMKNPWGVPEEQHAPIVIAEAPVRTLQELWPSWAGRN